jgi:hypothetical protein
LPSHSLPSNEEQLNKTVRVAELFRSM